MPKETRYLERIIKGFSNHRRIEIVLLLSKEPELSVFDISEKLKCNLKTISQHINKLAIVGIVMKRYEGNFVKHALTKRGKSILQFLRILE